MKKLRLLITKECNRACPGCCNHDWDLDALPVCTSFKEYNEVILTGGEPILKYDILLNIIFKIRVENPKAKIYLYTANVLNVDNVFNILSKIDGITLTLHDNSDIVPFQLFNKCIDYPLNFIKSLRLHIFKDVKISKNINLDCWKVKRNIEWIKNCPLPKNEVFMRLKTI